MTDAQRRKKRTKIQQERKDDSIRVRVTADQKRQFADAAQAAGLDVSVWLRMLGVREAKGSVGGTE